MNFRFGFATMTMLAFGALLLTFSSAPATANNAATVANQQGCWIMAEGYYYTGSGTEVLTSSGVWKYTCNGKLDAGDPPQKTLRGPLGCGGTLGSGTGDYVLTPGGTAHADCHGKGL